MGLTFLVLGASGMLGNACLKVLGRPGDVVRGTVRSSGTIRHMPEALRDRVMPGVDAGDFDSVTRAIETVRPDIVINCIGMVKQLAGSADPLTALPLNALFPHRLQRLCAVAGVRLVHVSTDCVFSGERGGYLESDRPDADDLYGVSKRLGEVDAPNAVTLRTSIIGHELDGARSLIDWFLSQTGPVDGFTRAIFSGVPTVELARIIRDFVAPNPQLRGLYHVSAEPIDKYSLLKLVAQTYGHAIPIRPSERVVIDRSLNSDRFRAETGYAPPAWPDLIALMHAQS